MNTSKDFKMQRTMKKKKNMVSFCRITEWFLWGWEEKIIKKCLKDNRASTLGKGIPATGFGMNEMTPVGEKVQVVSWECLTEHNERLCLEQLW